MIPGTEPNNLICKVDFHDPRLKTTVNPAHLQGIISSDYPIYQCPSHSIGWCTVPRTPKTTAWHDFTTTVDDLSTCFLFIHPFGVQSTQYPWLTTYCVLRTPTTAILYFAVIPRPGWGEAREVVVHCRHRPASVMSTGIPPCPLWHPSADCDWAMHEGTLSIGQGCHSQWGLVM